MRARYPVLFGLSGSVFGWSLPWRTPRRLLRRVERTNGQSRRATRSLLGSYLAGRVARGQHDTEAAADLLPRGAGARSRQRRAGRAVVPDGADGGQLAAQPSSWRASSLKSQPPRRTAHAFMGLVDFKAKRYAEADEHFKSASANPIGELTSTLARAWLLSGAGQDPGGARRSSMRPSSRIGRQYYLRFHRALLADQAGRHAEARAAYERIPKNDQRTLRVTLAYARHAANAGDAKLALSVLKAHAERTKSDGHPIARALQEQIEAGERPDAADQHADRGHGGGVLRSGRGAHGRRRRRRRRRLPAVRALPGARFRVRRWPRSPTPTRRPSATKPPSPPTTASPRARRCR